MSKSFPPAIGSRLANGARVVATHDKGNGVVVIFAAMPGAPQPYVTWEATSGGGTYWGHYFSDFGEAIVDYSER